MELTAAHWSPSGGCVGMGGEKGKTLAVTSISIHE